MLIRGESTVSFYVAVYYQLSSLVRFYFIYMLFPAAVQIMQIARIHG
jgi:hypothetical protein